MEITIRKAMPEDAYDYAVNHMSCWRDAYTGIIPDEFLDSMQARQDQRAEQNRQLFQNPEGCEYYCVMHGNDMIGRLVFHKCRDNDKPDAGEIGAIYLLADYWGKGYGKQMMTFALQELSNAGFREVVTWVLEENKRARRFYENCSFKQDGAERNIEIGKTLNCIRYVLSL